jgi:hypothetical protein
MKTLRDKQLLLELQLVYQQLSEVQLVEVYLLTKSLNQAHIGALI